ncbi:protein STICHEL-like 4 [Typha angustifolia]|uniref:protein STICHEL-like 4 n=1 Tax=Typha angustifolia TaxID=59011 RepID=UPI003C2C4A55
MGTYLLKHENGAVSDHLRSHVHLTNCIHLKNHMHSRSPNQTEKSLIRDLLALQRSRSLRDPSTSPSSWLSASVAGNVARRHIKDSSLHSGRRSIGGGDGQREASRMSTSSAQVVNFGTSKVAAAEASDGEERDWNAEVSRAEECSRKSGKSNISRRTSEKAKQGHNVGLKTLLEQLAEAPNRKDNDGRRVIDDEKIKEKTEVIGLLHRQGLSRAKKNRFRGVRRDLGSVEIRGAKAHSTHCRNSLAQRGMCRRCQIGEGQEEDAEMEVSQASRNVCGIPWNWSRIHHRGKSFLDMAGRSISCGRSDTRQRKADGPAPHGQEDVSNLLITSDYLTSLTSSDSEALPLLAEASGTQNNCCDHYRTQDYSGELGIFSNNSLIHEHDSDLSSEARSGNHKKSKRRNYGRHRCMTQKYMPRTFKDLVGQNLVAQALSNAVLRRKVGLVYVFYGPHGTGKTSCARVFAKALNCQAVEHPKPCDVCNSCISHNLGKSRNVLEVGPIGNVDFESIMDILDNMILSPFSSQYKVFIFDDCDTLPADAWSVISKVIDREPRHVVFVLVSCNLDLPHVIISRCQKFFFPKLKESDIINTLQWISTSEGLEIDKDALKLIASQSDGSLRDAEMTLDQLSLLGQRISLSLVQELVGLVSDEKLVDLLDLALSADTVHTVKSLREVIEAGVEPLALMSQLATIITDILAGSYVFTRERLRRKFFRRPTLSKEDMEKLRQALKTLSEAEKQLRVSNDKLTWLTAALLQLAPDQQYMLPSSSGGASLNRSPLDLDNFFGRDIIRNSSSVKEEMCIRDRGSSKGIEQENYSCRGGNEVMLGGLGHGESTPDNLILTNRDTKISGSRSHIDKEKIWQAVLEAIQSDTLRHLLTREGKLNSVSLGTAPTAQLIFSSHVKRSKAEKFRGQILQAFEAVLSSAVILEIQYGSWKDMRTDGQPPLTLLSSENGSSQVTLRRSLTNHRSLYSGHEDLARKIPKENLSKGIGSSQARWLRSDPHILTEGEIIEMGPLPQENGQSSFATKPKRKESVWAQEASSSQNHANLVPSSVRKENGEQQRRQSLVKGKVSLAHVINQAEGCSQQAGWSRRKAISIAEKLEQDNLRLEPRSRSLLCWKASRVTRGKLPTLRIKARRTRSLVKLVICGRCMSARSPR